MKLYEKEGIYLGKSVFFVFICGVCMYMRIYIYSIVFFDISMPLLESMLLSLLLTPVKIGPSNASPG